MNMDFGANKTTVEMIKKSLTIFVHIKMSYYWFKRQELLQKAKDKYHNYGGKKKLQNIISKIKIL